MTNNEHTSAAVILAGGEGHRIGNRDKCLLDVAGRSVLSRLLSTLQPQCSKVFLNVNGDLDRFAEQAPGASLIGDSFSPPVGPLGGIVTVMAHLQTQPQVPRWLLSVTGDTPFIPTDLQSRLLAVAHGHSPQTPGAPDVIVCHSGGRAHFLIALWSLGISARLFDFIEQGGRSAGGFIGEIKHCELKFETAPVDPFFNINTLDDWHRANEIAQRLNS